MDIKQTLLQIHASGMTQAQIAAAIECSQSTVSDLMSEKIGKVRPSYHIVEGIKRLAEKVAPKVQTKPRQQDPDHQKTNRTNPTEQQERATEPMGARVAPKGVL